MFKRCNIAWRISLIAGLLLLTFAAAWGQSFKNVVNLPFNTVSDGPQSALIVDVSNPDNPEKVLQAVQNRLRATRSAGSAMARQLEYLALAGLIKPGHRVSVYHTVILRSQGRILLDRNPSTRQGTPQVQFTITTQEGWTAQQAQFLKQFADQAYPILEQIYGPPANNIMVRVLRAPDLDNPDFTAGGVYIPSVTPRQILLPPTQDFDNFQQGDTYSQVRVNLLHLMIRAFHDTLFLQYHSWEEGISRAATTVAMTLIDRQVDLTTGFDTYFLMPVYDLVNQPSLGNNTFFPASGFNGMLIFRLGMAASAWLKVYIENTNFFRDFNSAYYAQARGNPNLAGDIPQLRTLVKGIVLQVEGLDFDRWYESQYVLDTSVSPGKRLYAFNAPVLSTTADPGGYSTIVLLNHYDTGSNGDETPLSGTCYPVFRDSEYEPIFPGAQYERVDIVNGLGAVSPNFVITGTDGKPDAQRITIDFPVGNENARVYFSYAAQPSAAADGDFLIVGSVIGGDAGEVDIRLQDNTALNAPVRKGAFGVKQHTQAVLYTKTAFSYGGQEIRRINFLRRAPADNFDYVAVLIFAKESLVTRIFDFSKGLSMISLPIRPLETDISKVFSLPYSQFIIAYWDQNLVGDTKYRLNQAAPPIRPDYGYWLKLEQDLQITVTGMAPNPDAPYAIGLVEGWNLIGFPFENPVAKNDLRFQYVDQDILIFADAVDAGWISGSIWEYDPVAGYQNVTQLRPGKAYWVKAKRTTTDKPFGMTLLVPPPAAVQALTRSRPDQTPAARTARTSDRWQLTLVARTGNRQGRATLGVSRTALDSLDIEDAETPPDFRDFVTLSFPHPDWGQDAGGYASDIRSVGATQRSWEFEVKTDLINSPVTLTWPEVQRLPRNVRLVLTDLSTGERRFLRTTSAYTFKAGSTGTRLFRIEADTSGAAGLLITGLTAVPTRGSGTTIAYTLSAPAQVTADILTLTGKPVRTLAATRAAATGANQMVWDGRSRQGSIVPGGTYLIQVTARSEDGETVRAVAPVVVGR